MGNISYFMPKELPISGLSEEDFLKFREEYLDKGNLRDEAITEIKRLFGYTGELCCNEYHAHRYECISWQHPESAIVARLINEIEFYQELIRNIHNTTK